MPFIETISPEPADGAARELTDGDAAAMGYLPNYTRLFAQRPEVYQAWKQLNGAIKAGMDPRRYELATIAAARRLRSTYCMLAHSTVMINALDVDPDAMRAIVVDPRTEALDETERAIMDLADGVVVDATAVTAADIDRLRELGLTDGEILDVILAATATPGTRASSRIFATRSPSGGRSKRRRGPKRPRRRPAEAVRPAAPRAARAASSRRVPSSTSPAPAPDFPGRARRCPPRPSLRRS